MGIGTDGDPWTVKQADGDYSTLNAALTNASTGASDFIEEQETWSVDDTANCTVQDTDITVRADSDSKMVGFEASSPTNYRLKTTSGHSITVNNTGFILDGIEIGNESTGTSDEGIRVDISGSTTIIKNSLLYFGSRNSEQDLVYGNDKGTLIVKFENVICYNAQRAVFDAFGTNNDVTASYNACHFYNIGNNGADPRHGIFGTNSTGTVIVDVFDCLCHTVTAKPFQFESDATVTLTIDRSITNQSSWDLNGDTPAVTDSTVSATWVTSGGSGDRVFVGSLSGNLDLRLVDDANNLAQDNHADGSGANLTMPSTDMVGTSRPQNTNFDVGAFEILIALALEQEGFRFRNNDGTEITATWAAAQDVNITTDAGEERRLRILLNSTGDIASNQFKLKVKKASEPLSALKLVN